MSRSVVLGEMTAEQRRVYQAGQALHRDGGTPAGALDLLATILEDRTWERVADKAGQPFAGRFREFVEDRTHGLNTTPAELVKVIRLRHPRESKPDVAVRLDAMRSEVERLLREEIQPAAPVGHPDKESTTLNGSRRRDAAATTARLKRDDPELAEKVVSGEISAYAAARTKGWKPPRIQVTTPERTAAHLRQHMKPDDIVTLARLLQGG